MNDIHKSIVVLGSTGSIGVNTLLIAQRYGIRVEGLVVGKNIELLNQQIKIFNPKFVAISDKKDKKRVAHQKVFCGTDGILELLEMCDSNLVVNALGWICWIAPT